jgi:hypothetical protein
VRESLRPPRPGRHERGRPRREHPACVAAIRAEALPHPSVTHDVPWSPGEIGHRADIATVEAPPRKPADRTVDQGLRRRHPPRPLRCRVVHVPGVEGEQGDIGKPAGQQCHSSPSPPWSDQTTSFLHQYPCGMAMEKVVTKSAQEPNGMKLSFNAPLINGLRASRYTQAAASRIGSAFDGVGLGIRRSRW